MKSPEEIKNGLNEIVRYWRGWMEEDTAKDAIAYIEQLEANQMKWISIKDRLPEKDGDYIALINLHQIPTDYTLRQPWFVSRVYYRKNVGFHWFAGEVTHWMPMPEPPKEG